LAASDPQYAAAVIIARLRDALRRQDWFAVALEIAIVVLGVAIGFQVTEWGIARAEREEEQELLRGLRAEFVEVAAGIEVQAAKHRHVQAAVETVLQSLRDARRRGAGAAPIADSTLAWALVPTTTQFSQGILAGMRSTGRLGLIRDLELRTALAEWEGVLADVTEDEAAARAIVTQQLDPILWSRMDVSSLRLYSHYLGTLPAAQSGNISEVPADFETIGAFAVRRYWQEHIILEFDGPAAEVRRILGLIDRSLD
jgi:hypothetical protein